MTRARALLVYLGSFFSARGLLFASPLLLASCLPAADYAQLEWALATATLASAVLTFGTGGLVPIVIVGTASAGLTRRAIQVHHLAVVLFGLVLLPLGLWRPGWALVLVLMAALSLVSLTSTELKSQGLANRSLFLDALLLSAMAGLTWLATQWPTGPVPGLGWVPAVILVGITVRLVKDIRFSDGAVLRAEWRLALRAGFPLMVTGALATLVTTSGRAGAGMLLAPDEAAAYAVLSRGAALPIVAHQVLTVAVFRQLYTAEDAPLNRLLVSIVGGVSASALALWLLVPWVGWALGPAFDKASQAHGRPLLLLLAQSTLWSAIALNDLMNVRHERSAPVLRWTLPAILLILPAAYGLFHVSDHSLLAFAWLHSGAMLLYFLVQTAAMWAHSVRLSAMPLAAVAAFTLLIALGLQA
jgi:hypothetical protein